MKPEELSAYAAVLQMVANLVLVALTAWYVVITRRQLHAATVPHVIVYVKHDESRPTILQLIIENVGKGLARDIVFRLSEPIPHRAFGLDEKTAQPAESMTHGPLIDGIPALGPGDTRKSVWGQYGGLSKALGDKKIRVTCDFSDGKRRLPSVECILEVKSFAIQDAVDPDGTRQSAKELRRIADSIEKFGRP